MLTTSLTVDRILGRLEEKGTGIFVKYLRSGPIYTCRCPKCGVLHGAFRKQSEAESNINCKYCHAKAVEKLKKEIEKVDDVKPAKDPFKSSNHKDVFGESLVQDENRICDSPVFKAWFAGSKVVNRDGSPKVVHHGSSVNVKKFKQGDGELGPGIYFATDATSASIYARRGHSIAAYLKANPYELTDFTASPKQEALCLAKMIFDRNAVPSTLQDMTVRQLATRIGENWTVLSGSVKFWLSRAGYDAITSQASQIPDQIMVFDRKQIWIINGGSGVAESLLEDEDDEILDADGLITGGPEFALDKWTQIDPEKANGSVKFGKMGKKGPIYFEMILSMQAGRSHFYHIYYSTDEGDLSIRGTVVTDDPDSTAIAHGVIKATDGDTAIELAKQKADTFFYSANLSDWHSGRHGFV